MMTVKLSIEGGQKRCFHTRGDKKNLSKIGPPCAVFETGLNQSCLVVRSIWSKRYFNSCSLSTPLTYQSANNPEKSFLTREFVNILFALSLGINIANIINRQSLVKTLKNESNLLEKRG